MNQIGPLHVLVDTVTPVSKADALEDAKLLSLRTEGEGL